MSACRSCGAEVRWVKTKAGKFLPLDQEPNEQGNVEIINGMAVVHGSPPLMHGDLYMPHHATCPSAEDWR